MLAKCQDSKDITSIGGKHTGYKNKKAKKVVEGSLEGKLPTLWTNEKVEMGKVTEEKGREKKRRKKIREEKVRRRKQQLQVRERVARPRTCGSGGSTSRLAEAVGAEPSCQMSD